MEEQIWYDVPRWVLANSQVPHPAPRIPPVFVKSSVLETTMIYERHGVLQDQGWEPIQRSEQPKPKMEVGTVEVGMKYLGEGGTTYKNYYLEEEWRALIALTSFLKPMILGLERGLTVKQWVRHCVKFMASCHFFLVVVCKSLSNHGQTTFVDF